VTWQRRSSSVVAIQWGRGSEEGVGVGAVSREVRAHEWWIDAISWLRRWG
jgi:hypothetical protein